MKRFLLLLPLVLIAAAPASRVEDLVRRGNDAFEAGQYAEAVLLYEQAEQAATDPGLVAYNKAAAFYRQAVTATASQRRNFFHRAEQHFRCAAEEAGTPRRLRACFGLANSILQGRADDAAALRQAIACYRECLAAPDVEEAVAVNARHNLEVAKLHLIRALERPQPPDRQPEDPGGDNAPKKRPDRKDPQQPQIGDGPNKGTRTPTGTERPADKDGKKGQLTDQTAPGAGKDKVLGDDTPSPPLGAEEADAELAKAAKLIRDEQRTRRFRSARIPAGTVKDW